MSYSLTAPAEILLIMYREKKQNTSRIGITDIATARYVAPWFLAASMDARRVAIITGRVNFSFLFRMIIGRR